MSNEIASLLELWRRGSEGASEAVLRRFCNELRALAAAQLGRQWSNQSIQATERVHEAWFRLIGDAEPSFEN